MKKIAFSLICLLGLLQSNANHIVGGEIEFLYYGDGQYIINLVQYFDDAQDENSGAEGSATVYIFRNSDNALISTHTLLPFESTPVNYTNSECSIEELATSRVGWTDTIALDPFLYDDEAGYYVQWERCCRNEGIQNITSPRETGMNYVTEIPPLVKDGQIFQNSSPELFRPLSDYACVGTLYYVEFTGVDADGDSLVYSLTAPLNSSAFEAVPIPQPKPHFDVTFADGYSADNMVPGTPALAISNNGLLTVTPSEAGLFVFSVQVEEYRNGQKIGQVRRDFQLLVVNDCVDTTPPIVSYSDPAFDPTTDTLFFSFTDEKCFNLVVEDILGADSISLEEIALNTADDITVAYSPNPFFVDGSTNSIDIEVCLPDCPIITDEPLIIDIITNKRTCPQDLKDTVRLMVEVELPPNQLPTYTTSSSTINLNLNDPMYMQEIVATDADNEELVWSFFIDGVADPSLYGFSMVETNRTNGTVTTQLAWNTDCSIYDFTEIQQFQLGFVAQDLDPCDQQEADTLQILAEVILPTNRSPVYTTNSTSIVQEEDNDPIYTQNITITDADEDEIILDFFILDSPSTPEELGFSLTEVSNTDGTVETQLSWDTDCTIYDFSEKQSFQLAILGRDIDLCDREMMNDTLIIDAQVLLPGNTDPVLSLSSNAPATAHLGETIVFNVSTTDDDGDDIRVALEGKNIDVGNYDISFSNQTGSATISSPFSWPLACTLESFPADSTEFEFLFVASDEDRCKIQNFDSLTYTVMVTYPENTIPQFQPIEEAMSVRVNEQIAIPIEAFDLDQDNITIDFASNFNTPPSESLSLEPATGKGTAETVLQWQPECQLLRMEETSTLVDIVLEVTDDACPITNTETLALTFEVLNTEDEFDGFKPPNIFTPNGDPLNETYKLTGNDNPEKNLPADNCENAFEYISIINRSGLEVFRSSSRDFSWSGQQQPDGVYFYYIKYTNRSYKGYLNLIR